MKICLDIWKLSVLRSSLLENCELWGTDNVQAQIFPSIFSLQMEAIVFIIVFICLYCLCRQAIVFISYTAVIFSLQMEAIVFIIGGYCLYYCLYCLCRQAIVFISYTAAIRADSRPKQAATSQSLASYFRFTLLLILVRNLKVIVSHSPQTSESK